MSAVAPTGRLGVEPYTDTAKFYPIHGSHFFKLQGVHVYYLTNTAGRTVP